MSVFRYNSRSLAISALLAIACLSPEAALANTSPPPPTATGKLKGPVVKSGAKLPDRRRKRSPHIVQFNGSMNNGDYVAPSICEASCFAATASFTTVPYFSLDQPRSITIAYNGDQAFPRPSIYADLNGDDGTGVAINSFTMSATLNGSPVTFLAGGTLLTFEGALGWVRLSGQFDASNLATNNYPVVITAKVFYADGTTIQKTINTSIIVVNEVNSPIAKGWTVVGVQHLYSTIGGGFLVTSGDGSGIAFSSVLGTKATDYSSLTFDNASSTYTRTYNDGGRIVFNSVGQEISAIELNGRTYTFSYDPQGRLQEVRDPYRKQPNGSVTFIGLSYDANGLHQIQEPGPDGSQWAGRNTWFTVDASRCLLNAQDPDGVQTQFTCDSNGRLSAITDRRGGVTTIGYDASTWKLSTITLPQIPVDAGGGGTTLTNPAVHFYPWQGTYAASLASISGSVQDPAGRTTSFTVNKYGQAVDLTDPAGLHTTTTTYGILPTRITHPAIGTDTLVYDTLGRVIKSHLAGQDSIKYTYLGFLLQKVIGPVLDTTTYHYNTANQLDTVTHSGSPTRRTIITYNSATLRPSVVSDNMKHLITYAYDGMFGNLDTTIAPGNRVSSKTFDHYGRDSIVTPAAGAAQVTTYDILNRVITASASSTTITLGYDQLFQTDFYDANNNHYHTDYNALGWPVNQCDAFSACSTTRYNASGALMSTTNRRGQLLSLTRDNAGRITSRTGTGMTPSYYSYSANGHDMVAWNAVETDSVFNNPGDLAVPERDSVVTWIDGKRFRVYHRYPRAIADYDSVTINSNTGTIFYPRVAVYSSSGFLSSLQIGSTTIPFAPDADGTGGVFSYPGFNRTSAAVAIHQTGSVTFNNALAGTFQRGYHYDPAGRIDQMMIGNSSNNQQTFGYDMLGRLTERDTRSGCTYLGNDTTSGASYSCPTLNSSDIFTYDAMGNRTDHGGVPTTGNRYTALNNSSYYYDADGNVIQKYNNGGLFNRQWYWNALSQLDSAIKDSWYRTDFDYNAFGKPVRVWEGDPNGRHVARYLLWDGEALVAELDPNGQRQVDYVYLPGDTDYPFAHTLGATTPTEVRYHEVDELGNVVGTSASGSLSQSNSYDAWGSVTYSGNADQHLTWKGLWWNGDNTGLYYMRNRWYDPEGGRFVSEDPAGFEGGINLYAFSGNDPVNGGDPYGLGALSDCEELYMYQVGDNISFGWEDAPCPASGGGGLTPDEPTEPPTPQLPGGDPGQLHGGGGGRGAAGTTQSTTDQSGTDWGACLTQAALLTGTLYLDMETFGEAAEARSLATAAGKFFRAAGERRRMKAVRGALRQFGRKNLAASAIIDDAVAGLRQEAWAMGPAVGISNWVDAASLIPFVASFTQIWSTAQACRRK